MKGWPMVMVLVATGVGTGVGTGTGTCALRGDRGWQRSSGKTGAAAGGRQAANVLSNRYVHLRIFTL